MENNNFGQVKISNDVVATIAGLAALEVEGVETNTTFTDKILKNNGVKIQIEEEEVQGISFKKEKAEKEEAKQSKKS